MARVELRAFIRATPERIWEIIADLEGQQRWMVDVRSLKVLSLPGEQSREGPLRQGAVLELRATLFGLPLLRDVIEITAWEPPKKMAVLHKGQFTGSGAFELEPVRGGTIFLWWEDFKPPLGVLGELAHAVFVRGHLKRTFARSMENLRRLAEQRG